MKIRIKSVKSKIIVFFIGLAAFQICVMAGFAKLQLEPSIVSMYSEHLERFADVALTETTQETEKIERYMVNIIGDAQIQDFLRRADEEQSAELPPVLSTELRNRILSYTDYDNIITAIYLVDNYGRIYSNLGKSPMQTFMNRNQELKDRKEESAVWYGGENGNTITVYRNVNNNTTDLTQKIGALCIFIDRKMFQERIDDLYMQLRQQSDTDIIVDCTSDISQSKLTAKAVITADVVIELLTCDTNGLVFDGSQEPILQSEQYTYRKFVRMMSLSSVFKQDEAAMKNAMGRISGTIPYCPKAAEYLNQGTLLTKGVDDRTYNTTIKSLAEIIMKEE